MNADTTGVLQPNNVKDDEPDGRAFVVPKANPASVRAFA
jgi:hypothetical protein